MTDTSTPERVLVVEDSATQAAQVAALLKESGYAVDVARSGEEALALAKAERFDLVLTDIVMPGMGGFELCRRLKADPRYADTPVVLLTGLSDPLDIIRGLECGADNYITKPFTREHLLGRLRHVLENRRVETESADGALEVTFLGRRFSIHAPRARILDLLLASYEELVRSTEAVRAAEQRSRFLAEASALLTSSLETEETLEAIARLAVPAVADLCVVQAVGEGGPTRRVASALRDPALADVALRLSRVVEGTPDEAGIGDGRLVFAPEVSDAFLAAAARDAEDLEILRALELRSAIVAPLVARGNSLGTLLVGRAGSRQPFGTQDVALTEDLARRAALAIDNARLYREANQATRARDDMLAIVSHDLRNPVGTILTASIFMEEIVPENTMPPAAHTQLSAIVRAARNASALIDDLMDVSRIESGRLPAEPLPSDPVALLRDIVADVEPGVREKAITLVVSAPPELPQVLADPRRIAQVFGNLVGNAVKFTRAGGRIELAAEHAGDAVVFSVRDTGAGIPAEHLPHIFDRFWQARETARLGAGLGLFIAQGIVNAHGGRIWVTSTVGEGSTFSFSLPLA